MTDLEKLDEYIKEHGHENWPTDKYYLLVNSKMMAELNGVETVQGYTVKVSPMCPNDRCYLMQKRYYDGEIL